MLRLAAITLAALLLMPGLASADPNQSFEQCQRGRTDDNGGWIDCENKEDEVVPAFKQPAGELALAKPQRKPPRSR